MKLQGQEKKIQESIRLLVFYLSRSWTTASRAQSAGPGKGKEKDVFSHTGQVHKDTGQWKRKDKETYAAIISSYSFLFLGPQFCASGQGTRKREGNELRWPHASTMWATHEYAVLMSLCVWPTLCGCSFLSFSSPSPWQISSHYFLFICELSGTVRRRNKRKKTIIFIIYIFCGQARFSFLCGGSSASHTVNCWIHPKKWKGPVEPIG